MSYRVAIFGFTIALALSAFSSGCKSPGLPTDPLLVSRKPLKADFSKPTPLIAKHTEPTQPQLPTAYLAARAPDIEIHETALDAAWPFRARPSTQGVLTSHPRNEERSTTPNPKR